MFLTVILIVACAGSALAQRPDDPLCVGKPCPRTQSCRVVAECTPTRDQCTLTAKCVDEVPDSHTSVCQIGETIIVANNGSYADLTCGSRLPCPPLTYCNTELMDTYATCCRSDPANTVKPGACPVYEDVGDEGFCLDTCNNDGDCRHDSKCCQYGCSKGCLNPV